MDFIRSGNIKMRFDVQRTSWLLLMYDKQYKKYIYQTACSFLMYNICSLLFGCMLKFRKTKSSSNNLDLILSQVDISPRRHDSSYLLQYDFSLCQYLIFHGNRR